MKRILSIVLTVVMLVGILPIGVMAVDLPVNGGRIDITDNTLRVFNVEYMDVYKQTSFEAVSIEGATQEGTAIDVVLAADTNPAAALQVGFGGTGSGTTLQQTGNKGTLSDGKLTLNVEVTPFGGGRPQGPTATYTINFTIADSSSDSGEVTVTIITNLSESEVKYTQGKPADALKIEAKHSEGETVSYQWYSNTVNSTEGGTAIAEETTPSYTPATAETGTIYYYAVATCGELSATSKIAKITVEAPVVKFNTDLAEGEVKYTLGKPATALAAEAEYTGVTENPVTYQWYSYKDSIENAFAIPEATTASYTPETFEYGTTCYYVVAFCEGLTATSKTATIVVEEEPPLPVVNNVIDIADKRVYSYSRYYADVTNISISGADVERATQDDTTVDIVLDGVTALDAEVSVVFGTAVSNCTVSGHIRKVKLENGVATLVMVIEGKFAYSRKGTVTYTLNFSLGEGPLTPPVCLKQSDSFSTHSGVAVTLNLLDYFEGARAFYLMEAEEKTPLDSSVYTFMTFDEGEHTLVFAASNDKGECPDLVTVTINVTEIKSGAWLGIETSNGSVNYVLFTDVEGNAIEGLIAYLDGTAIKVSLPRSYIADKVMATFDLTQAGGYPKLSTNTAFNGTNDTKVYTTTLSGGSGRATMYLYNVKPGATSNNYTTYTIDYSIINEVPVLADGQSAVETAGITADLTYTVDLDGIFTDPDEDDYITGWRISVNGATPTDAVVDENNVYSYKTDTVGQHTLVFYGKDKYNSSSVETYTVSLNVENSVASYDVTVSAPEGSAPVFYSSAAAEEGTELYATSNDGIYNVKVPTNVSIISWRDNGVGMSANVSEENNALTLIKPSFIVKAGDDVDANAVVSVTHSSLSVVGNENNYLLLEGEKYNITAAPGADYEDGWKMGAINNYTLSEALVEINLVNKSTAFTIPSFAELTVSEASTNQGMAPVKLSPDKTTEPDPASETKTVLYRLTDGRVYEYRVSVPGDESYVTYVATFTKKGDGGITVTEEQLESGDNGRTTVDRDANSNRGRNVADLYTNVNAKGYKKLKVGDKFKLIATRNYRGVNADWLMGKSYYYIEPDFHYSVVDENGQPSDSVITIDDNGNITAKGEGSAIVLITYDAMTMNQEAELSEGSLGDYASRPNEFYGAIWPENTGVFVVTVGAGDSGIKTGITINEDKATSQKLTGKAIDAELDVIYFIGDKGEYTFTPATEGVKVSVANPTVSDKMSFTGFKEVKTNKDGSVTVPLTTGRNIVKLTKDGKAEYQVITAKGTNVKVNGVPLEAAEVAPGEKVCIEFDSIFAPVNRMMIYNTAAAVVYSKISGWDGRFAGNARGSYGEYNSFASYAPKRTVEHFVSGSIDDSGYSNSQVTTDGELVVPEDFEGKYFTLSGGSFNIGGFMPYLFGSHYEKLGTTPPASTTSENVNCYLGRMPDIVIPIAGTARTKTTVSEDKKAFAVNPVNIETGKTVILALYDGDTLTETQKKIYDGNEIPFTTEKAYTDAKVFVWDSISDLTPVCDGEIVR